jgi:Domain of unknown function (DUF5047)
MNQLRQSHTSVSRALILRAGRPVAYMLAVEGNVSSDADRSVMRNASATVVDPYGQLSGADANDLLNPYNCEVVLYRGVQYGSSSNPTVEYAPLGVFQLTGRQVTGDGEVQITGQDRSIVYQGPMTAALTIDANTPIETAIIKLLVTRSPGLRIKTWKTGFTCGPLIYAPDIDVWKEAQTLAQSAGIRLFHDRVGLLNLAPALPTGLRSVRRWAEGDGLLLGVTRQEDSDTIRNVVVAEREAGSLIRAVVMDTNPRSPTYAYGKYGFRVVTITNASIGSITQAQQVARNELVRQLGRSETVSLSIVPDPTLDPLDPITLYRPNADLTNRTVLTQTTTIPLGADQAMTVGCRKFLLTEDGQQLDVAPEMTTS